MTGWMHPDAGGARRAGVRLKRCPRIAAGSNDGLLDVLWERARSRGPSGKDRRRALHLSL